ncbi:unnamed protein product [Laminaria digitata]
MSLIESNVRGDDRSLRDADRSLLATNRGDPVSVSVVVSAGEEGSSYALSAAELATIESERTKEKLRTKADHVANFHRKVVRRLAVERRAASTVNSAINSTTGAGAGSADDDRIRQHGHVYECDYAITAAGAAFEPTSSGRTLEEEQRALREHSNETLCYRAVKVVGKPGDARSLSDADTQARIALAAYSYRTP